ncbi:galactose-specific lectin nattectin-like isoform X2 [Mastacembelus armatus]|uniref:galactose-specific lectin nattectin-like isoform X2 n=1 Tax=Mastacembelus armatus TaxID=205130 RepID=UPI000E46470F|nr:galactose-specific lectin nattectin-like isoform X2 [Mastacembelus armatus]
MASHLYFIVVLCLTAGLWTRTMAQESEVDDDYEVCCVKCPPGWTQFGDNCYIFYFNAKDWADAEVSCISVGGNLASIHTQDQYNFVTEMISRSTGSAARTWIGGHDAVKEGVWLWSNGEKFDFTFWAKGEPNNVGQNEDCLELNYQGKPNDCDCKFKNPYVCSMRL